MPGGEGSIEGTACVGRTALYIVGKGRNRLVSVGAAPPPFDLSGAVLLALFLHRIFKFLSLLDLLLLPQVITTPATSCFFSPVVSLILRRGRSISVILGLELLPCVFFLILFCYCLFLLPFFFIVFWEVVHI